MCLIYTGISSSESATATELSSDLQLHDMYNQGKVITLCNTLLVSG